MKGCQWLRIWTVTLCWEGMTSTSTVETEFSSHTKETSKNRLRCGSESWSSSSWWGISFWEVGRTLTPPTCDWDDVHTSLYSYCVRILEWISRRSRERGDDHTDTSFKSSLKTRLLDEKFDNVTGECTFVYTSFIMNQESDSETQELHMSVGTMKDSKLNLRNLHSSLCTKSTRLSRQSREKLLFIIILFIMNQQSES
jgi:hypothetical protein